MVIEDQRRMEENMSVHDRDSFGEVYDYYFSKIYNFIFARIRDVNDADEIVSVVFEKAFSKLDTFDSTQASFSTWLFSITKNTIRNFLRTKKIRTFVELDDNNEKFQDNTKVDEQLITKEVNKDLMKALDQLSQREKEVVSLKFWGALSNKEIGQITGMKSNHVGVTLHRALKNMKSSIESQENGNIQIPKD